jgi:thiol-disulfide isomerase/thioredoxin
MKTVHDRREMLGFLGVGLAAAAAGIVVSQQMGESEETNGAGALRFTRFTDLADKPRTVREWNGLILVVNFWATWCAPCRQEIPELVRVRDKLLASGVEFVGIAIDQVAKVSEFARTLPISYPLLIADAKGLDLLRKLGNPSGGLPYTVVLDRKGQIAHRNLGVVTQEKIETQLRSMLAA